MILPLAKATDGIVPLLSSCLERAVQSIITSLKLGGLRQSCADVFAQVARFKMTQLKYYT